MLWLQVPEAICQFTERGGTGATGAWLTGCKPSLQARVVLGRSLSWLKCRAIDKIKWGEVASESWINGREYGRGKNRQNAVERWISVRQVSRTMVWINYPACAFKEACWIEVSVESQGLGGGCALISWRSIALANTSSGPPSPTTPQRGVHLHSPQESHMSQLNLPT